MVSSAPFQAGQSLQRYKDKEERLLLPFFANADGNNPFILISNIKHPPETMVKCRGWTHIFGTMEWGCLIWTGDGTSYEPFVLPEDVSFSDRLRCRETTRLNERTRMRLVSRVSSREILDGWHQVLLSIREPPKKSMGWAYYWCILAVVGAHSTMTLLSSICCRRQFWTILMLQIFGNIHRKSWFLHVFTLNNPVPTILNTPIWEH